MSKFTDSLKCRDRIDPESLSDYRRAQKESGKVGPMMWQAPRRTVRAELARQASRLRAGRALHPAPFRYLGGGGRDLGTHPTMQYTMQVGAEPTRPVSPDPAPADIVKVCANCGQWVRRSNGNDCLHECRKRGFAC